MTTERRARLRFGVLIYPEHVTYRDIVDIWQEVDTLGFATQGNCTLSAGKTEELGEIGQMPASAFAFDFQRAFAGISP